MSFKGLQIADTAFLKGQPATSPDQFPNLVRWYKADTFALADGTPVGGVGNEWIDQSTLAQNATQATVGKRPVFHTNVFGTKPAVQFDNPSNQYLTMTPLVLAGTFTIIVIGKASTDSIVFGDVSDNAWARMHVATTNIDFYWGAGGASSDAFTGNQNDVHMSSWRRSGAAVISFREGNTARGDVADPGGLTTVSISEIGGTLGFSNSNFFLGEACVYNTRLSDVDIGVLYTSYFKPKWGLP